MVDFYEENLTGRVPFELWEKYEQGYYASKERAKKREKEQPKGGLGGGAVALLNLPRESEG